MNGIQAKYSGPQFRFSWQDGIAQEEKPAVKDLRALLILPLLLAICAARALIIHGRFSAFWIEVQAMASPSPYIGKWGLRYVWVEEETETPPTDTAALILQVMQWYRKLKEGK